jgi:hypothetical protein
LLSFHASSTWSLCRRIALRRQGLILCTYYREQKYMRICFPRGRKLLWLKGVQPLYPWSTKLICNLHYLPKSPMLGTKVTLHDNTISFLTFLSSLSSSRT